MQFYSFCSWLAGASKANEIPAAWSSTTMSMLLNCHVPVLKYCINNASSNTVVASIIDL